VNLEPERGTRNGERGTAAKMPKAIFWDNDGVLVDTEELYFKATQRVLADVGIALTEADYIELFLIQGRGAFHLATDRGMSPAEVERLRSDRNLLYGQWLAEAPRTMDDVRQVLEALHGRYVMGVVTSSRKDHFDVIHAQTGLLKYFDFVLTAADVRRVKPDPEPYLRAVERSGFKASECLAIEDSARGLEAARAAGVPCVVVPTRLTRGCEFPGADGVLPALGDLLRRL
jgi:HAD superfamily hydrolase (TIGR01509 family)